MRVGNEAALGEPFEDLVEAPEALLELALFVGQKAVDVERQVVLVEGLVLLQHLQETGARLGVARVWWLTARIGRLLFPLFEALDELVARVFPLELAHA
ncbi:hypothetical protein D3C83_39300 [compost metagenome]